MKKFHLFMLLVALLPTTLATAQETIGQYVVREGDTLQGITARYLGSNERWKENFELNRSLVDDPNLILPGMTLRILLPAKLPENTAKLARKSRQVTDRLPPRGWRDATPNDLLLANDELQTAEASSAEIAFSDSSLFVTELTLIIFGLETVARAVSDRQQIAIQRGQADLELKEGSASNIEVRLGNAALSRPRAPEGGRSLTRNRVKEGQGQLMVYEGESEVEAGGEQVGVGEGMGTSITPGQAPSPPEKLLDPPEIVAPLVGARLSGDPTFEWQAVPGAVSYTVEVCRDANCGELVSRGTTTTTSWQSPTSLDNGNYFWRVNATSASGLDGYPSGSQPGSDQLAFMVGAAPPPSVPAAAYQARLLFSTPKLGVGDRLVTGPGIAIDAEVEAHPDIVEWQRLLNGEVVDATAWEAPFDGGSHTAAVQVKDRFERTLTLAETAFDYDPDPPEIRWGREGGEQLGSASGETASTRGSPKQVGPWAKVLRESESSLVWTSSSIRWLPMKYGEWEIQSDEPYIVIRSRKKRKNVAFPSLDLEVGHEEGLWIHFVDEGCGVKQATYQIRVDLEGREILILEAVDSLGNLSRVVWPFAQAKN